MLFIQEKEEISATGDNMDGPLRHYAKRNKPHRGRKIVYAITYMCHLNKSYTHRNGE